MRRLFWIAGVAVFMLCVSTAYGTQPVPPANDPPSPEEKLQLGAPPTVAKLSFQQVEEGKLLVTATDAQDDPIKGLNRESFNIRKGAKTAKILSVEPLETSKEIGLNIVMVVDNSQSMQMREAVEPLLQALNDFSKTVRPIDNIHAVVFDERSTLSVNGKALHAKSMKSSDAAQLRSFFDKNLQDGLTDGTYLYDAMVAGLDIIRSMPENSYKFLVVFTDGQDLNSVVKRPDVEQAAAGIANFTAYALDYMPDATTDKFLHKFSTEHGGRIWKASSASDLLPVFQAFTTTLLHRYVVNYRFLNPPSGRLAFTIPELVIEELTTIDSAPLLNYVYFDTGQGTIPERYALFKLQTETAAFKEEDLRGGMQKYSHLLNIVGKRLQSHPEASVRLVGCNSNTGQERGRQDLSLQRAEAVRAYLQYIWNIEPGRVSVEKRNLPQMPSTNKLPEGQAENQRVEIYSDHPAILDTVNSEHLEKVSSQKEISILATLTAEAGLDQWRVNLHCGDTVLKSFEGQNEPPPNLVLPLDSAVIEQITACDRLRTSLHALDMEAKPIGGDTEIVLPVRFVQRQEQMANKQGYRVNEQYALILFDFDSAAIKERNQVIVQRIIERIRQVPDALISITGHTDTIGSEEYNLNLSQKRAEAVRNQLTSRAAGLNGDIFARGVGPIEPLHDNNLPEGRALNRTVIINLDYVMKQ